MHMTRTQKILKDICSSKAMGGEKRINSAFYSFLPCFFCNVFMLKHDNNIDSFKSMNYDPKYLVH